MCLDAARFLPAVPFVSADTVSQMLGPSLQLLAFRPAHLGQC